MVLPRAGEHHGDAVLVGGLDHLVVAHRATGLDHRGGAGFDRDQQSIGKREEGVGRHHRAFGHWHGELLFTRRVFRFARGDAR